MNKIMPPTYLLISVLLMVAMHLLLPLAKILPPAWNLLGIIPIVLGVIVNLSADKTFHDAHTTVKPFEESTVLMTAGLYRISRNPMYLGFVFTLIGVAALLGSLSPYVVVVGFTLLIDRAFIHVEERMLAKRFGPAWWEYAARTRRWI